MALSGWAGKPERRRELTPGHVGDAHFLSPASERIDDGNEVVEERAIAARP